MTTASYLYNQALRSIHAGYPRVTEAYIEELRQQGIGYRKLGLQDGKAECKLIAMLYHQMGFARVQERFNEITRILDEIRATWTPEQIHDFTFHDPVFAALCGESFYLMTGGAETLTLSAEQIEAMADEVVEL